MCQAIKLLEAMGASAVGSSKPGFVAALAAFGIDMPGHGGLSRSDHDSLNRLLGGRGAIMFGVFAAEEDDQQADAPVLLAA
jgi:hypothetical protein